SRFMSFSGFTIIILSFFLMGLKGLSSQKAKRLFMACAVGIVVLILASYEGEFYLEWDIYSYVIASVVSVLLLARHRLLLAGSALTFFVLLLLPRSFFLNLPFHLGLFQNPLLGDYNSLGAGSWPLIPWLGVAVVPYYVGTWFSKHRGDLKTMDLIEKLVWAMGLLMSIPQLGAYYQVPIGPNFYNFVFNCGTLNFWSHLIWVFFFMRLSFVESVNQSLNQNNLISWVSRLQLNQRFFLFYLVQLGLIGLFSQASEFFLQNPFAIDVYLLAFIPIAELICRRVPRKIS
ncbi:MAG: hypothetical protein MJK18_06195, partial [Bdellovibrionales bacterium]|nr:hypothetical protein [Bdellovibrionales bacterium]